MMAGNELAAALEAARADEREKTAQRIVAHADKHAPADGNPAQRRMRRHLLMAARVAAGPMTMERVAEALAAGNYMVCLLDETGRAIGEGEAVNTFNEGFEDWLTESRLTLKTTDDTTGLVELDLVEVPLTGWGDEQVNVVRLTREGAEWLRDTLTDALGGAGR